MQDLGNISREQAHKILAALNNPKSCLLCVRYDQYEEMFLDCGQGFPQTDLSKTREKSIEGGSV
jgi:hypothetical protein